MAGYFSVKSFDKFQHYKDRRPPWIKLYNDLLDDYEFCLLPDASKMHLIAIWLLASRYSNLVPADAEWISRRISATETVDLGVLVNSGFIVPDQDCSDMLASCKQVAPIETEGEGETEEERNIPSVCKESAPIGGNQLVEITASLKAKPQTKGNGDGRKRRQQVPLGWWPSADSVDYARERSVPDSEVEQFRNYHIAKGTLFADIEAGWRTWANNHVKFAAQRLSNRPRSGGIVAGTLEDIAAIESEI
jgi:hypothetical protein